MNDQLKQLREKEDEYTANPPLEEADTSVIDALDKDALESFSYAIGRMWYVCFLSFFLS